MAIQKSATGDLLRGSEVFWHRLTMAMRTYLMGSVAFSATALLVVFLLSEAFVPTNTRAGAWAHFKAEAALMAEMPHSSIGISITDPASGKSLSENLPADQMSEVTQSAATRAEMWLALFFAIGSIAGQWVSRKLLRHQKKFGLDLSQDEFLRGGKRVTPTELAAMVKNPSPYKIGNVPIPEEALTRNVLMTGGMGVGKSQAILPLMQTAREIGQKMLIYDKTSEFTERFFRPGIDHILNPFDARCEPWSVFEDVQMDFDFAAFSTFFVPENKKSADPMWDNSARMFLEDAFRWVFHSQPPHLRSMRKAREFVLLPLKVLASELARYGLNSVGTMNPENEKTAESVRATLMASPAIKLFDCLPEPSAPGKGFSIRKWVLHDDDSCLFVPSRADLHEAIKPFASAWVEMTLLGIMAGKRPDLNKLNCLIFLDELGSLQKMRALETALTEGRKFGIATVGGIQGIAQLDETFGQDISTTLIGNFQTKLVFRVDDERSAERYSKLLGAEEIEEAAEGNNFGSDTGKGGINLQRQRKDRALVTMGEIQYLPNLTGFLKISGGYPVAQVSIERHDYQKHEPDFIPRSDLEPRVITPAEPVKSGADNGADDPFELAPADEDGRPQSDDAFDILGV